MKRIALAICLTALSACAPQEAATTEAAREDGLTTLSITTESGRHDYLVEVARTSEEQARGLMYRQEMARDRGMIFPFSSVRPASFWMKNTYIPLDIVFYTPDMTVESVAANTIPLSTQPYSSLGPVGGVLELNGGEAARIGMKPGDRISVDLEN